MVIVSRRIQLRLIESTDLEAIHNLHLLPKVAEFNTLEIPENIEETNTIITSWIAENKHRPIKNYTFAIENTSNKVFIGLFGLKLGNKKYKRGEVWYKIHPDFWKKGFATESLIAVINYGFDTLQLHRIQAGCAVANLGSIKVLEKAGMQQEGRGRLILPLASGWSDNYEYAILESDKRPRYI